VIPAVLAAYQLLCVAPWATAEEVTRAYRAKAKELHPDASGRDPREIDDMVRLNDARLLVIAR